MKVRRFFANVFLLVVFAAVVFFIGWIQFMVKPGKVGVMESKTSGLLEQPVLPGTFLWRWERLLPTNVTVSIFDQAPREVKRTVSGTLPSAELYAAQVEGSPDFSYRAEVGVSLQVSPQALVGLVGQRVVQDQAGLDAWLDSAASRVADAVAQLLLDSEWKVVPSVLTDQQVAQVVSTAGGLDGISVTKVQVLSSRIPDTELYALAKKTYADYQATVASFLAAKAEEQAASIAEEDRTMTQLEKFGELLAKYPQLDELSKQGNITEVMNALRSLR